VLRYYTKEENMGQFHGVVPAIISPKNEDGTLNEEAFRATMEFNIQAGVHGFWVAGGTGESVLLDDDENMAIARAAADQNRGRVNNIMHVGAATTLRAARLAENAAAAGVEAICCVPPFFYRQTDENIVEHYRTVAAAADLPLFLYNLPQSTGVEITPELMAKIQDAVPQLKGLKHSSVNFTNVYHWVDMGLDCLIGSSALMLPALTIGASGCVDGPPNIAPEMWVEIWRAYQSGDLDRAEQAQKRAMKLVLLVREFGMHAVIKALLSYRLGIDVGDPRLPTRPLTPELRDVVIARAEAIGVDRVAVAQSDD
jgi:dihydrodipicolinate synthase/N-acetylneuraminate lyase